MSEVISGLEADLEEVKALMRSSSTAFASAAKALVRLRNSREGYIALVDAIKSGQNIVKMDDLHTSDLLSPLLLLLSHRDVPQAGVCASLSGIQRLAQARLLSATDCENIYNMLDNLVLRKESSVDTKLLQTCTVLATSKYLTLETCGRTVMICSRIADEERTKSVNVRSTAIACLTQVSGVAQGEALQKLVNELSSVPERNAKANVSGFLRTVAFFNTAASKPSSPPPPSATPSSNHVDSKQNWIEPNKISNKDALEVLDSILLLNPTYCQQVGPIVVQLLRGKFREIPRDDAYVFGFSVRLLRIARTLLSQFPNQGLMEELIIELVLVLESNKEVVLTPIWQYVLTCECLLVGLEFCRGMIKEPLMQRILLALEKLTVGVDSSEEEEIVLKSRGLDYLSESEPPTFSNVIVVLVALECMVAILADGTEDDQSSSFRVGLLLRRSSSSSGTKSHANPTRTLLEHAWPACLEALSRLLQGFSEENVVQYLLRAYLSLTTSCAKVQLIEARDAFISSMCVMALTPPQAKLQKPTKRYLNRKHLQILKTLFNVAHGLGEMLGTSWVIVLETFDELDFVLHVQKTAFLQSKKGISNTANSSKEEEEDLEEDEVLSEDLDVETKMIESMLQNLFETSKFLSPEAVTHLVIALSTMIFTTLSLNTPSPSQIQQSQRTPVFGISPKRNTTSGARRVMESLAHTIKNSILLPATPTSPVLAPQQQPPRTAHVVLQEDVRFPPFCFEKLVETAELNMSRIEVIWEAVSTTLLTLASSSDVRIRLFAVKSMEKLVIQIMMLESKTLTLRLDVVKKFSQLMRSPQLDTRELALRALHHFVSSVGHRMEGVWNLLVAELLIVSLQTEKSTTTLAFKVVQLIMDDYRPSLDMGCLPSLALCLKAFGEQHHDMNMALTAVHLLWLLCEKGDECLVGNPPTPESLEIANALWLHVFNQLQLLSLDSRMEVRNSALRSLCTNMVQCGERLTVNSWKICSLSIMLPLIVQIDAKAMGANSETHVLGELLSSHSDLRMTVHHSQDTEEKQWRETRITALQGASKILCTIMQRIQDYSSLEWFDAFWSGVMTQVEQTLTCPSPAKEVVTGAVSVLEELGLLVLGSKSRTKYAVPGMKVENGALVQMRSETPPQPLERRHEFLWPKVLQVFQTLSVATPPAFDVNVADILVNVIAEFYDTKECSLLRTEQSLYVLLGCCTHWVICFNNNGKSFMSSLERDVLKVFSRIVPIELDHAWNQVVFPQLHILSHSVSSEDFLVQLRRVHIELFDTVSPGVKTSILHTGLSQNEDGLDLILFLALCVDQSESVWLQVLSRAKTDPSVLKVLMEKGLDLLALNHVPKNVQHVLLSLLRDETNANESFRFKVDMIQRFLLQVEKGGVNQALGTFLECTENFLVLVPKNVEEESWVEDVLKHLFALEIRVDEDDDSILHGLSLEAFGSSKHRGFPQPHLIHLIPMLEHLALSSSNLAIREMCIRRLSSVALQGWRS